MKKQRAFVWGTFLIVLTWGGQTFYIDSQDEEIKKIESTRTDFYRQTDVVREDTWNLMFFYAHRKDIKDSTFKVQQLNVTYQQAGNTLALFLTGKKLSAQSDSVDFFQRMYNGTILEFKTFYDQNNVDTLKTCLDYLGIAVQEENFRAQNISARRLNLLSEYKTLAHWISIILFAFGTFCIAYSKAIEYLLKEKEASNQVTPNQNPKNRKP